MSSGVRKEDAGNPCEQADFERLYENMATGLHALAQPLTVLRSAVVACANFGLSEADNARYMQLAAENAERACGLFDSLQQLLTVSREDAAIAPFDLSNMLAELVADHQPVLAAGGIELKVEQPDVLGFAMGNIGMMRQVLFSLLSIAGKLASPGDAVQIGIETQRSSVNLRIGVQRPHGKRLGATERLSLVLAEQKICCQRGEFDYVEDPFCVRMSLPVQDAAPEAGGSAYSGFPTHQVH